MNRAVFIALFIPGLLVPVPGCEPSPQPPPLQLEPIPPAPRFVLASKLNLRAQPSAQAPVLGSLALNQPVQRLQERGEFARVRALNAAEGWVAREYLSETRLSTEQALERARGASEPEEALVWWQRAAALAPRDRGTLLGLAQAYERAGQQELSLKVQARLQRPEALWAPSPGVPGQVWVPWGSVPIERDTPSWLVGALDAFMGQPSGFLDLEALRGIGQLAPAAEQWWVLPAEGRAVKARELGVGATAPNECDATIALITVLEHDLPDGTSVVAAWAGDPPSSWHRDPGQARRPGGDASVDRARRSDLSVPERAGWRSWPDGDARMVRADWLDGPPSRGESDAERWATRSYRVTADGVQALELAHYTVGWADEGSGGTLTRRDIDGDGRPDSAGSDGCREWIGDDLWSMQTETRCCGC